MDNETLEGNKLIAEFMGWNKMPETYNNEKGEVVSYGRSQDLYTLSLINYKNANEFEYHSSWDWLMPVIKKIENINHDSAVILEEQVKVLLLPIYSEINKVWCAVVEFIKWYNENK